VYQGADLELEERTEPQAANQSLPRRMPPRSARPSTARNPCIQNQATSSA